MVATIEDPHSALFVKVKELAPLIRKHASEAEQQRHLSPPVVKGLREAGFFRMFRPRALNGLELDPVTTLKLMEAVARIDGATGWNVGISNSLEVWGAWLSEAASEEIYGSPDAVVAGGFEPHRRAVAVEGGYRVSGRSSFCSNCHSATWFGGLGDVYDGDEPRLTAAGYPVTLLTFIPASDARIVENWETLGMCGTGSHDVEVKDAFVPEQLTVVLAPLETPNPLYAGPLHRVGFWSTITPVSAAALGIAQAAIDALIAFSSTSSQYSATPLRDRASVQQRLGEAEGKVSAARALLHTTYDAVWQQALAGQSMSMADKARCQLAASQAPIMATEAVELVYTAAGTAGIRNEQPFGKLLRDIHVVKQHGFTSAARLESVGQIMLGLEPTWPFFAF